MNWNDEGVILSVAAHGETAAVAEVLTRSHGRHLGLVHGGRSRRLRPVLQPGSHVEVNWKARLSEHLGAFTVEPLRNYSAGVMDHPSTLAGLTSMMALAHALPERDPHPNLYEITLFVLGFLDDDATWPALVVRWEVALLGELGFGLDLGSCAATGQTDDLVYVSPKSGRAVSRIAGEPYRDKLLHLPEFLRPLRLAQPPIQIETGDVAAGLALTAHFLESRVYAPRDRVLPEPRQRLATLINRRPRPISASQ